MSTEMFLVIYSHGNNNKKPVVCVLLSLFLIFVHDSFDSASKPCVVTGAFLSLWQFLSNIAWKCPYVTSIQKFCCFTIKLGKEMRERKRDAEEEKPQSSENWHYFRALAMPKIPPSEQWNKRLFNIFFRIQSIWFIQDPGQHRYPKQQHEGFTMSWKVLLLDCERFLFSWITEIPNQKNAFCMLNKKSMALLH